MRNVATRPWHSETAEAAVESLASSASFGLSQSEVDRRLIEFGSNALPEGRKRSSLAVVARQFKNPLIFLILLAAGVALVVGEVADALVILCVMFANVVLGAFQEGRAERSLAALRTLAEARCRVCRNGAEKVVSARELVPGDILLLAPGDAVSADARIIDGASLEVAEASLTGESVPVSKQSHPVAAEAALADRRSMVYSGTHVTAGRGKAVVLTTGANTELGRLAALTVAAPEPTPPLELRVRRFSRYLVVAAGGVFALVLAIGLIRGIPWADILMVAISQLVAVVPEGLPVAITLALAVGVQRMASRGAIVRRLAAVEALGSTTVICSDKTGTLTRNEMTVVALWLPSGVEANVSGVGYSVEGQLSANEAERSGPELQQLLHCAALCNDAVVRPAPVGDPTELALAVLAEKGGVAVAALRQAKPRLWELPFSSETKLMATGHEDVVFLKGAPEAILALCAADEQLHRRVQEVVAKFGAGALRVLALAKAAPPSSPLKSFDALRGKATLLGLVGQMDPPREEVRDAVAQCRRAGIRTLMVTGDHKGTAIAVARQLGIAAPGDDAIDGAELERIDDVELQRRIRSVTVFARVHPSQKYRIVEALHRNGEVVAMTGDGVNDAPALARADVGVAMGQTGTEVAKEASKIIITDDNFATIVRAVEEGRVVYRNIKAVILLLLATGIGSMLVLVGGLVTGLPLPLLAVQILWINVVTDGTVTVSLMMDPAEGDEMNRPPTSKKEGLVTSEMIGRLVLMTLTISAGTLAFFSYRLGEGMSLGQVRTATFTLLAVFAWFTVLSCRSDTHSAFSASSFKNGWLIGGLLLSNVLQIAVVFVPALNSVFHTEPIPVSEVFVIGAIASSVLWVEELRKLVRRRQNQPVLTPSGGR